MVKAIKVYEHGGFEVMKWEDVDIGEPKEGEIKVKIKAIGVNYCDAYMRKGTYPGICPPLPFTPGIEAAGIVIVVGPGVTTCKVGDMVAYAGFPVCAYIEEQILPADRVVPVPPSIDPIVAAAVLFKGITAHMLVRSCLKVGPEHTILIHAAAGGVGSLVCQWANALGATVIGTVSNKMKAVQAKEDGCHHVIINYTEENFVDRVMEITSGEGVDIAYDSIGKDTFKGTAACLKFRGHFVSFGHVSGLPEILFEVIAEKCLFFRVPGIFSYTKARNDLLQASNEIFSNVIKGVLRVRVNHKYPLSQAVQAHIDIEERKTTGSLVLIPDN